MSDKSNKYGYVGVDIPAQSFGSNKGVFNPAEINDLVADNQWTTFGQLELIETQNITTTTANVDFTDLGDYNVHFLTYNNAQPDTDNVTFIMRSSNDGGSTFETTNYQFAAQYGITDGTFAEGKNTTANNYNPQNDTGTATNERANGYLYLYNFLDSSKYNFVTGHSMSFNRHSQGRMSFGSAVYTVAETHNAIRLLFSSGNIENVDVSLYGIRYS